MTSKDKGLEAARKAKTKAARLFARYGRVCGVGITRRKGAYCVKVNLESAEAATADMPDVIDDVPVIVEIVGKIRKQDS
jgi:hypothetical protein